MNVEKNIIRELEKNMNWKERILLKILKTFSLKIYNITRIITVNKILKNDE